MKSQSQTQMVEGGRPVCRTLLQLPNNQCCRRPLVSRQSIKASSSGPAQVRITLPIPRHLQLKHKSRGNRWTQTARLEGSTWKKRKPRNARSADGTAHPFCWDWFCPFLLKLCMKMFTCSMYCTDKAGGKNGSPITTDSGVDKRWPCIRACVLYRRSQIRYFCLNDTTALTAFLTSCPMEDSVLYPFVYLLCCRNRSYDSSC